MKRFNIIISPTPARGPHIQEYSCFSMEGSPAASR